MRAFSAMMPQLDAEERLAAISDRAVSNGGDQKHARDRDRHMRALQRAAQGGRKQRAAKASPAALAAMGIGVSANPSEASQEAMNDG